MCPTKSVLHKTPEEARVGYKPNVEGVRVFRCIAYAHIPDEKRKKFDDKGEKCIFVGYSNCSKGYKLFNPKTNKVIVYRDVEFIEDGSWDWTIEDKKQLGISIDEL